MLQAIEDGHDTIFVIFLDPKNISYGVNMNTNNVGLSILEM